MLPPVPLYGTPVLLLRLPKGVPFRLCPEDKTNFVKSSFDKKTKIYKLFCLSEPKLVVYLPHNTKVFING